MKVKTCSKCGKPFDVIEDGDEPADLKQDAVYLAAASKICLQCHRAAIGRCVDLLRIAGGLEVGEISG